MKMNRKNSATQTVYLDDIDVSKRYVVCRATPWRWVNDGSFPKPIKLSHGCTRWLLADLEEWEKTRRENSAT